MPDSLPQTQTNIPNSSSPYKCCQSWGNTVSRDLRFYPHIKAHFHILSLTSCVIGNFASERWLIHSLNKRGSALEHNFLAVASGILCFKSDGLRALTLTRPHEISKRFYQYFDSSPLLQWWTMIKLLESQWVMSYKEKFLRHGLQWNRENSCLRCNENWTECEFQKNVVKKHFFWHPW